ncbi:MAG TPA: hypothetical protein VEB65_08565, partial [Solirubrobacterales bacterium]|nr:hypothetical protein [Solirubrobacterales bacterium]
RAIRTLKRTLTQDSAAPSQAEIARRIRLADRIEDLEELRAGLTSLVSDLAAQASRFRKISAELAELGTGVGVSESDQRRIGAFADLIRELLAEFNFSGVPPADVEIAPDNYLPMIDGSQLRPEPLSASDRVRMVWAYVVGLLEFSREWDTPHPGVVILDEPGQQEVNDASLGALLLRVAGSAEYKQQVIVATSKPVSTLDEMLGDAPADLLEIEGYALAPV